MDLSNSRVHPDYIAAALMIAMLIVELWGNRYSYDYLLTDFSYDAVELFLNAILAAIGAAILLLTKHESIVKTMAVIAITFAIITLDSAVMDLVTLGEYMDYELNNFIEGAVLLLLGAILLINTIIYCARASNNLTLMFYSFAMLIFLDILQKRAYFLYDISVSDILFELLLDLPKFALIILAMALLRSDTIRVNTMMFNVKSYYREIRKSSVPAGVRIGRSEISVLEDIAENGLDRDIHVINLNSFYPADYKLVLTKAGEKVSLCFASLDDDTGLGMARFILKGISTDTGDAETCDTVRIYSEDMFFIQLIAGEEYKRRPERISLKELVSSVFRKEDEVSEEIPSESQPDAESPLTVP